MQKGLDEDRRDTAQSKPTHGDLRTSCDVADRMAGTRYNFVHGFVSSQRLALFEPASVWPLRGGTAAGVPLRVYDSGAAC